jgi:hypothetical protein
MPEAAIDEDGDPRRNEDDIDENALGSTMKSISEIFLEKGSAQGYLGRRVLVGHAAHDLRTCQRFARFLLIPDCLLQQFILYRMH